MSKSESKEDSFKDKHLWVKDHWLRRYRVYA